MSKSDTLVVDPEFQRLLILLTTDEREWLKQSLKRDGCRDPLVAWRDNGKSILMDGHNRREFCTELAISFGVVEIECESREAAKIWIRKNQLARRNLPDDARAMLAERLLKDMTKQALSERGKLARRAVRARHPVKPDMLTTAVHKSGNTKKNNLAVVSKAGGISQRRVKLAKRIDEKAVAVMGEDAAKKLCDEIEQGRLSLKTAKRTLSKAEGKKKLEAAALTVAAPMESCVRHCSMQELLSELRCVDCICVDPPYGREYVYLYGELAMLAKKALKPDGILCVMAGQAHLPEVLAAMTEHLRYLWTMAYLTLGSDARIWNLGINVQWKPVLLLSPTTSRLADERQSMCDVVKSDSTDKRFHEWGQSESGMSHLIERLTVPGQLVCDCFAGAGTTLVAAAKLHRRIIGCDTDAEMVRISRMRLKQYTENVASIPSLRKDGKGTETLTTQ